METIKHVIHVTDSIKELEKDVEIKGVRFVTYNGKRYE
ncbi:MFS transporter [Bacillus cereus group sp. MG6]